MFLETLPHEVVPHRVLGDLLNYDHITYYDVMRDMLPDDFRESLGELILDMTKFKE